MKMMKRSQKQQVSSSDEDSDIERNYALFTERRGGGEEEDLELKEEEPDEPHEEAEQRDEEESDEEEQSDEEEEGECVEREDDGGSGQIETSEDVKKELSHMSFEDVMKLQNKVGTKVYNEVKHGSKVRPSGSNKKRVNKNRPMEISAKKPAPFLRQVVAVKKTTLRDPRFDDLSGEYKADIFEKTYGFINDIKHKEKEVVQKKLKKTKNDNKKEKLQYLLKRMENQERARLSREQQRNKELQFKRQQRERANQGQAPLFLKKSQKKKLQLLEKYQDLKKSGKLENFLSKKRKRNAGKDRRKLPPQQHWNTSL